MAVTEHGRMVLYRHFEAEMGEEKAQTLMDHLLPVAWTELATKQDLQELEFKLTAEMHKGFTSQTRCLVSTMVALQADRKSVV
jgi:hypothetical protein